MGRVKSNFDSETLAPNIQARILGLPQAGVGHEWLDAVPRSAARVAAAARVGVYSVMPVGGLAVTFSLAFWSRRGGRQRPRWVAGRFVSLTTCAGRSSTFRRPRCRVRRRLHPPTHASGVAPCREGLASHEGGILLALDRLLGVESRRPKRREGVGHTPYRRKQKQRTLCSRVIPGPSARTLQKVLRTPRTLRALTRAADRLRIVVAVDILVVSGSPALSCPASIRSPPHVPSHLGQGAV